MRYGQRSRLGFWLSVAVYCGLAGTAASAPFAPSTSTADVALWRTLPPTPVLPTPDRAGRLQHGSASLWYAEYAPSARTPVLLLHGGFANSAYLSHLIKSLVGRGYYVIAMDTRGHGRSTSDNRSYDYRLLASDVIALLDHLKIAKVDLVGWSDGGCIGLQLAVDHSPRLNRLFSFGANADISGLRVGAASNPVFVRYLSRTESEYRSLSSTPREYPAFQAAMMQMWSRGPQFTRGELASISAPTTIADGQYDEGIRPDHNIYIASTIPGANLVVLPNVSHFAMLQNPDEFDSYVLAFLAWR